MRRNRQRLIAVLMTGLMLTISMASAGEVLAYVWPDRNLAYGMTGEDVLSLQTALNDRGYQAGEADGIFGAATENALREFQSANGLYVDGVAGNMTFSILYGNSGTTVQQPAVSASAGSGDTAALSRTLSYGMNGSDVSTLQTLLKNHGHYNSVVDGIFGEGTQNAVISFQKSKGLYADGIAGPLTFAALSDSPAQSSAPAAEPTENTASAGSTSATAARQLAKGMTGSDVLAMQKLLIAQGYLNGAADGEFGPVTESAVIAFQKAKGLYVDGIAGPATLTALQSAAGNTEQPKQEEPTTAAQPQTTASSGSENTAATVLTTISNAPGGIRIDWQKNAGAASYRVFRKAADGSWQTLGDTKELYYIDKTAVNGTRYTYTVRALSSGGSYAGDYDKTGLSFTYTYNFDSIMATAPASVTKEDIKAQGKKLGMDIYEIQALIGWVEGEAYHQIGEPYLAYLSACVVLNGILDGLYGRSRDLVDRIETWGSYYSPNAQKARYDNASQETLMSVYLAMTHRQGGIYYCRGAYTKPENCFYDPGIVLQGQSVYVW